MMTTTPDEPRPVQVIVRADEYVLAMRNVDELDLPAFPMTRESNWLRDLLQGGDDA